MAVLFPKFIDLNDKAIAELKAAYAQAADRIAATMEGASGYTLAHNQVVMAQIIRELNQLGVDTTEWLHEHIPAQYQQGMADALAQMKHLDMAVTTPTMEVINHESLQAIMQDASTKFGQAITTITRSAQTIMSDAVRKNIRQRLAANEILGVPRQAAAKDVADAIREGGIYALRDAAGKRWAIDTYADMLVRTKLAEARNTGLTDMLQQNGYDLVEVSSHGALDVCGDWEGAILSISGDSTDYDSVEDAVSGGLFHPNCRHSLSAYNPPLSELTSSYINDTAGADEGAQYLAAGETLADTVEG